jgi:hypothetical protein
LHHTDRPGRILDSNNSIALDSISIIFDDTVSHRINIKYDVAEFGPTNLGGYYLALKNKFNSEATLRWVGAVGYELLTSGSISAQYAITNVTTPERDLDTGSSCTLTFADPTMDIINSARELMFRTALGVAAGNSSLLRTVAGTQTTTPVVYELRYLYIGIAVALTGIAVFFVTLTFTGYWHLGRAVSMSPRETAKAFNAPLLENADSNADVKALMTVVGKRSVRYGAVSINAPGDTYAAGKEGIHASTAYIQSENDGGQTRLEMAEERIVQMPRKV